MTRRFLAIALFGAMGLIVSNPVNTWGRDDKKPDAKKAEDKKVEAKKADAPATVVPVVVGVEFVNAMPPAV